MEPTSRGTADILIRTSSPPRTMSGTFGVFARRENPVTALCLDVEAGTRSYGRAVTGVPGGMRDCNAMSLGFIAFRPCRSESVLFFTSVLVRMRMPEVIDDMDADGFVASTRARTWHTDRLAWVTFTTSVAVVPGVLNVALLFARYEHIPLSNGCQAAKLTGVVPLAVETCGQAMRTLGDADPDFVGSGESRRATAS